MWVRETSLRAIARAVGCSLVGAGMITATLQFPDGHQPLPDLSIAMIAKADPLRTELAVCRRLSLAENDSPQCEAVWAEGRQRFFAADISQARLQPLGPASKPKTRLRRR
jgi:conjugative transfer region protein TrbK